MDASLESTKTPLLVRPRYRDLLNAVTPPSPDRARLDGRLDQSRTAADESAALHHLEQTSENETSDPEPASILRHEEALENRGESQQDHLVFRIASDTATARQGVLSPGHDQAMENRHVPQERAIILEEVRLHPHQERASWNTLQVEEISNAEGTPLLDRDQRSGGREALQEATCGLNNETTAKEGEWYPYQDCERRKQSSTTEDAEGATSTTHAHDDPFLAGVSADVNIKDVLETIGLGDWFTVCSSVPTGDIGSNSSTTPASIQDDDTSSTPTPDSVENAGSKALDLLMEIANKGIDGVGSFVSAAVLADEYRNEESLSTIEERINSLIWHESRKVFAVGFATGLFGLAALPVTVPASLFLSWVTQARLSGAIANLCGYDVTSPQVRTLVMVTLLGDSGKAVLKRLGVSVAEKMASHVIKHLPSKVFIEINKAVGHRLITRAGTSGSINLIKWVPVIGGVVGGSVDCIACTTTGEVARWAFYKKDLEEYCRGPRTEDSTWEWEDYVGSD